MGRSIGLALFINVSRSVDWLNRRGQGACGSDRLRGWRIGLTLAAGGRAEPFEEIGLAGRTKVNQIRASTSDRSAFRLERRSILHDTFTALIAIYLDIN